MHGIYFSVGSNDMAMLSVDPLDKYLPIYILDHGVDAADIARSTLHPLNDTRQTRNFVRHAVRWRSRQSHPEIWARVERRSNAAFQPVAAHRVGRRLWALLKRIGCARAAAILAVALSATPLARRWRESGDFTVFAPSDSAFNHTSLAAINKLLEAGNEAALMRFVRAHAAPGIAGPPPAISSVGPPLRLDWLTVQVVDRLLIAPEG